MSRYVHIEDMTWPSIERGMTEIARKLTFAPENMTRGDQLVAASVISAYCELVNATQEKRNMVCQALKDHIPTEPTEREP